MHPEVLREHTGIYPSMICLSLLSSPLIPVVVCVQQQANGPGRSCESPKEDKKKGQGRVEEQINNEHLRRIEAMFHEADTDGGGG